MRDTSHRLVPLFNMMFHWKKQRKPSFFTTFGWKNDRISSKIMKKTRILSKKLVNTVEN